MKEFAYENTKYGNQLKTKKWKLYGIGEVMFDKWLKCDNDNRYPSLLLIWATLLASNWKNLFHSSSKYRNELPRLALVSVMYQCKTSSYRMDQISIYLRHQIGADLPSSLSRKTSNERICSTRYRAEHENQGRGHSTEKEYFVVFFFAKTQSVSLFAQINHVDVH